MKLNLLFLLFAITSSITLAQDKPNIIFIMADDMGYGDPECYNPSSKIPTPNMNKLAKEGMLFTDAHSASSVCTPSRYSTITGNYAWRSRLKHEVLWSGYDTPLIDNNEVTIADLCKRNGYATAAIGKWHLGINFLQKKGNEFVDPKTYHEFALEGSKNVNFNTPTYGGPNELGFDYFFGSAAGQNMEPHAFLENRYTVGLPTIWREKHTPSVAGTSASEVHEGWMVEGWNDEEIGPTLTEKAIDFIENSNANKKPFFIYFTPVAPHRPCTPPDFAKGKSEAGERGDMVFEFDWSVGKIMDKLDELGISENTILIVTSDNGATRVSDDGKDYGHQSCGNLNGYKASLLEGGHRVPFLVKWPNKIQANSTSNTLISNLDLYATMNEIFNYEINEQKDSESFLNALMGEETKGRSDLIHSTYSGQYAIRKGEWKLIPTMNVKANKWNYRLFNLTSDPFETKNLANDYPELVQDLKADLEDKVFDF